MTHTDEKLALALAALQVGITVGSFRGRHYYIPLPAEILPGDPECLALLKKADRHPYQHADPVSALAWAAQTLGLKPLYCPPYSRAKMVQVPLDVAHRGALACDGVIGMLANDLPRAEEVDRGDPLQMLALSYKTKIDALTELRAALSATQPPTEEGK